MNDSATDKRIMMAMVVIVLLIGLCIVWMVSDRERRLDRLLERLDVTPTHVLRDVMKNRKAIQQILDELAKQNEGPQ